jgi:peptidase M50-like protein/ClpA/ClpB-like protein
LSYSGVHKPPLLGRLASLIGSGITLAIVWWFTYTGLQHVDTPSGLLWLAVGFLASLAIGIILHEAGHLVVGMAVGQPARKIRIGSGSTVIGFHVGGLIVQICTNPLAGGAVYFSGVDSSTSRTVRLASLAAGPAMNLLAVAYGFGLAQFGATWLGVFAVANLVLLVMGLMPATTTEGGRQHVSDGMQILRLLMRPPSPSTYFEGAATGADAQTVMVRALEDAEIAGAPEATDEHLLRALSRDEALAPLFASIDLVHKLPPGGTPETSVDTEVPRWSATAHEIIEVAFRKARDLGITSPNAACVCLALLEVDCPAGRLLKEAGIPEEALRKLATTPTAEQADTGGAGPISPDLPLERWGTAADKVLAFAHKVAAADGAVLVGTQHLVAALVADPQSRSARALSRAGFLLVRHDRTELDPDRKTIVVPMLSPQAAAAVAGALWRTGPTYPTGTGELCLGIIDNDAGIGGSLLASAGVTVGAMTTALRLEPRESSEPAGCTAASLRMWELRGSARIGAGRWMDSRADFLAALGAATNDAQRAIDSNNVAWASLMSGDPALRAEALELSRTAFTFKPDMQAFIGTHAFALLENGSPAEAAALIEPIAAKTPRPRDRASQLCVLAMCRARLHEPEAAVKNLDAAREADPKCSLLARAQAEVEQATAGSPASPVIANPPQAVSKPTA